MWRIVEEKGIDPNIIRHTWTRVDVMKFNAILDMRASYSHAETGYNKQKEKRSGS